MRLILPALFVSALLAGCDHHHHSGGSALPPVGSIDFVPVNTAVDLSPDGRFALLTDLGSTNGDVYVYNTDTSDLVLVTTAGSPQHDFVTAISSTGRVSALHADPVQAGLWTAAGGWIDLGSPTQVGCGGDIAAAWDISADGHVAVGMAWNECAGEAFCWNDRGGVGTFKSLQVLGSVSAGTTLPPTNRATVISDDGRIVAGFAQTSLADRRPAIWRASGSGALLRSGGLFSDDSPGEVLSISADGRVVAGIWNFDGFFWSPATGTVDIGRLPTSLPGEPTYPNAIAAGGQLIFGACGDPFLGTPAAFVWTQAEGMRALQDVAAAAGVNVPIGWSLSNVLATSTDGSIVLGTAFDASFNQTTFVLKLPVTEYGL